MGIRIQHRRDTALNWFNNNPTLAGGEVGYESDTGRLKIGDGLLDWNTLLYFGGTDYSLPEQYVLVDAASKVIPGKRYKTWAAADAYVQTQVPSSSSKWAIVIGGPNAENIVVRDWCAIVGVRGGTVLTGALTSTVGVFSAREQAVVVNCEVANIAEVGGLRIVFEGCRLNGGAPTADIQAYDSQVTSGDFRTSTVALYHCQTFGIGVSAPRFGVLSAYMVHFRSGAPFPTYLDGNTKFYTCRLENGGAQIIDGTQTIEFYHSEMLAPVGFTLAKIVKARDTYFASAFPISGGADVDLERCTLNGGVTVTNGSVMLAKDCVFNGLVDVNTGGAVLTTKSCVLSSYPSVGAGGTWNNEGAVYDNRTSALVATNEQTAIDELAARPLALTPDHIVIVQAGASPVPGKVFQTWAAADTYVQTQLPTEANRWGILIHGTNAEAIMVRNWIAILGYKGVTRLTGAINAVQGGTRIREEFTIWNCIIDNIALTGGIGPLRTLTPVNCEIRGGAPVNGIVFAYDCLYAGGTFTNCSQTMVNCEIMSTGAGPTFGSVFAYGLRVYSQSNNPVFAGGEFYDCTLDKGTFGEGNYVIEESIVLPAITLAVGGSAIAARNTRFAAALTLSNGANITTTNCVLFSAPALAGGSTWVNAGATYDNRTSGLVATNEQAAIDEIAAAAASKPLLQWGNGSVTDTTTTRYLTQGYEGGNAPIAPIQFRVLRAGTIRRLRVRHNTVGVSANAIVYTLRKEGAAQALTCSVAANVQDGSDLANSFAVAAGDRLDIEVTKALALAGGGPSDIVATVEYS